MNDFVQAVITNPDATVCKLSSPINLQANAAVSWAGNGVSGSTFNPAVAGPGVHKIIATKTNGSCPDSKDTLTITVDDFVQVVIATADQTLCINNAAVILQANTSIVWSGNGISGNMFNPAIAGAGTHQISATHNNGACPDSKDTLLFTIRALVTPDVNITASSNTISSAADFSNLITVNTAGGGANPLFTFAKDRNFTEILLAESAISSFRVLPQMLNVGSNFIYVRMRSSENCVTSAIAIDSVQITLNITTPLKSELEKSLKVFPNPNDGLFSFRFETGINDNVSITVYDAAGKLVFKEDYGQVQQFNFSKTLNLRNRHKGNYVLQFKVGSEILTRRLSLLR